MVTLIKLFPKKSLQGWAGEPAAKNANDAQLETLEQILKRVDVREEQESENLKEQM
jgi:hypothetical protein